MNSGELLSEGLGLLVLGMGTVFVFLTLLVIVTTIMSSLVLKYAPVKSATTTPPAAGARLNDQTLLAVISAAIHAHRSRK
ncbi:MAG: OadG family protein [Pseudohongiellaceae bacterium]